VVLIGLAPTSTAQRSTLSIDGVPVARVLSVRNLGIVDFYDLLKLTAFMCHSSGFPQSAAEPSRLPVLESGTICLKK
jgi:hypothetical protein